MQELYEAAWAHPEYRAFSPGEHAVLDFIEVAEPKRGETLRDLGCGTGRAGNRLAALGLEVTQYDFAENCRDAGIDLPFVKHDLKNRIDGLPTDYAFCTDVLEHIAEADVPKVLENVVRAGWRVFLGICTAEDDYGPLLVGEHLHLTVKPAAWWREQLEALEAKIPWEKTEENWCWFYVAGYADAKEFPPKTVLNVPESTVLANVRANLEAGYREVEPHEQQDTPLLILAGGPSLNDFKDEIIERRKAGAFIVTVNNTHQVCREWGIEPSLHIMCDAREFNKRFVENPFPRTKYLIASQCHPSVAASLPKDQVLLWHSGQHLQETLTEWDREHGTSREWYPIFGGGTVMLRALPLLVLLGFHRFELFGFDSSLGPSDEHHAYSQPENDRKMVVTVRAGRQDFRCHPWMVAQAGDFLNLMRVIGPHVDLIVHGDGLIARIIQSAAEET